MAGESALRLVGVEKSVSVDYIERIFACYREGRVVVPIDAGMDAPAGYRFEEVIRPAAGGGWFTTAQAPNHDDAPAQVSFSSGTTGTPKAILLSHRALADATDRLIAAMEIDSEISEYLGVPPTYSFGLGRARVIAAVGGKLFVPSRGFDPTEFARMLEAGEINALSAVPTLLRALLSIPDLISRKVARKLRWLEIGSQPMSADEKQAVRRLFPAARIIQHYGLTEASRTTFLDVQEASAEDLETVGRPIGRTEVRIDGEDRICIRGPHVADGVLTADGLVPLVDSDGWLVTNDLGRIDDKGFVTFLGRADHLINVGGIKVSAELFEQRLTDRLGADGAHVAVAAALDPLRGQKVMVAHLPALAPATLAPHARAVGETFGLGVPDVALVQIDAIPRTDTGKIQRSELTELHGKALPAAAPVASETVASAPADGAGPDAPMNEREREIAAIWHEALGISSIGRNESFFDLGGDSLSAITVMLRMERAGIPKSMTQQIFEGRTIAEIAAGMEGGAASDAPVRPAYRAQSSDAITMVRALLVGVIVIGHWSPFLLLRGGHIGHYLLDRADPFFHFGTPGFAMVFGIGLSYFSLPLLRRDPARLRANMRVNAMILAAGVAVVGLGRFSERFFSPEGLSPIWISNTFYNVLTAYLLLVLTITPMMRFIDKRRYPLLTALGLSFASLIISAGCRNLWGNADTTGVIDLARLLIVAKYGYAEMLGYVFAGVAMGLWIDRAYEDDKLTEISMLTGVVLFAGCMLMTIDLKEGAALWFGNVTPVILIAYAGIVLFLFGLLLAAVRGGYTQGRARFGFRILLSVGVLAFVFYITHESVLAATHTLEALGLSEKIALGVPMLLFVVSSIIAIRWIYRLYYGGGSAVSASAAAKMETSGAPGVGTV